MEYGKLRKSKVEQELDRISRAEATEKEREEQESDNDNGKEMDDTKIEETDVKPMDSRSLNGTKSLDEAVRGEEEREMEKVFLNRAASSSAAFNVSQQYNSNDDTDVPVPVPPPRLKKQAVKLSEQRNPEIDTHLSVRERWKRSDIRNTVLKPFKSCKQCGSCVPCRTAESVAGVVVEMENEETSSDSDVGSQARLTDRIRQYLPLVRNRQSTPNADEIDILTPDYTNKHDLTHAKEVARREKRDRKALTKRLRARRRAELAIIAKYEAKQKTISNAIELLLQILRMMSSFAILVGNIRKTFIPVHFNYIKPGQNTSGNMELMAFWRVTVFLDVLLFWTNVFWAYCLQWHLCCRLGLLKFWTWVLVLVLTGGVFMLYPMSYVQDNLDVSWCRFKANSTLARYQMKW